MSASGLARRLATSSFRLEPKNTRMGKVSVAEPVPFSASTLNARSGIRDAGIFTVTWSPVRASFARRTSMTMLERSPAGYSAVCAEPEKV